MNQETIDYIESWNERYHNLNEDNLNVIFEKFGVLYTLHNRLYNDSFRILKESGRILKPRNPDHEKASTLIIEFLSADVIVSHLNDNLEDIESIAKLIENEVFHINLEDGKPKLEFDTQLVNNLRSQDSEIVSKAILMTIYNVRNNMVHGEKHFQEHQRLLLEPLNRILKVIINLQIEKQK